MGPWVLTGAGDGASNDGPLAWRTLHACGALIVLSSEGSVVLILETVHSGAPAPGGRVEKVPGGCTCPKNEAPAPRQEATVSSTPAQHVGTDTGWTLCILKPRAACRGGRGMDTVYPGAMGSQRRRQRHLCAQMLSLS